MERLLAIAAVISGVSVGCGSCGGERATAGPEGNETEAVAVAVVEGVVKLAEGAELPAYPVMERSPAQPAPPEDCPPPREADRQPVRLGSGRTLEGLLIAAAEFDQAPAHTPETHQIAIRDCRLTPLFVPATRGDTLEIRNETDYPFMPVAAGGGMARAIMRGESRTMQLDQGGVKTVTCTFTAPCGRADVVTLYHPVHTLSGEGGRFRLEVPAGEELEIHAWHPLFQEASATVDVPAGETHRIELTLHPAPVAAPEPPAQPEGEGEAAETEGHPEDESQTLF